MNLLEDLQVGLLEDASQVQRANLAALIAGCDDKAGNHIIWVGIDGEVHATCIPVDGPPPDVFIRGTHSMALRLPTAERGLGFVGQDASECAHWVSELYGRLSGMWRESQRKFVAGPIVA